MNNESVGGIKLAPVLHYLLVVKCITAISMGCMRPYLQEKGYSDPKIDRYMALFEFFEVALFVVLLRFVA